MREVERLREAEKLTFACLKTVAERADEADGLEEKIEALRATGKDMQALLAKAVATAERAEEEIKKLRIENDEIVNGEVRDEFQKEVSR